MGGGREHPGALSFKLGPGSHYLPNQHSHNVKQQTDELWAAEDAEEEGGNVKENVDKLNQVVPISFLPALNLTM